MGGGGGGGTSSYNWGCAAGLGCISMTRLSLMGLHFQQSY